MSEALTMTESSSRPWGPRLSRLAAVFLYAFATGFGLGLFSALLSIPELHTFSQTNALTVPLRNAALLHLLGWILAVLGVVSGYLVYRRSEEGLTAAHDLVRAVSPLGLLWPFPLYFNWQVFNGGGLLRVVLALIWGLSLERAFRHTFRVFGPFFRRLKAKLPSRFSDRITWVILAGLIVWFATFCAHYTVMQHQRMGTTGFDLGIFDNLFYNLREGEWFRGGVDRDNRGGAHLQFHANFLAYLFLPIYVLSPRAETLLIMQAWIVALSAVPLYLLSRHRLGPVAGLILAFAYLVHEATQGPVFYDFHFLTISPFFIGWTLYFFDRGAKWPLLGAWICAVLLREDQGAVLGAAALVYLLLGHRPLLAILGGLLGVAWLALMRFYVMPLHAADGSFQQHIGIFQAMVAPGDTGYGGVIKTIVTNPVYSLNNVLEERKLEYLLLLSTPFVLLPFRSPRLLFLFIPAAMFTLGTANYPPPVSKGFQYTMYWMPMLILGSVLKLSEWKSDPALRDRFFAGLTSVLVLSTALGVSGGALFQKNSFTGGFRRIVFEISEEERNRYKELRAVIAKIPPKARLTATEAVVPHVSNRRDAYTLRQGLGKPDYFILWKLEARGGEQARHLLAGLGPLETQKYGVVEITENFMVWKRGAPRDRNLMALQSLGHLRDQGRPPRGPRRGERRKEPPPAVPPAPVQPSAP